MKDTRERMKVLLDDLERAADMVHTAVFLAHDPGLAEIRARVAYQQARYYFFCGWTSLVPNAD